VTRLLFVLGREPELGLAWAGDALPHAYACPCSPGDIHPELWFVF
jgi:hypothetical protein